jgi:uncharacterized protein (DUF1778 family)
MPRVLSSRSAEKSQRINFRASPEEERLIRLGAEKRGEKVTRFIVRSACTAAEMAIADQKSFELSPAWFGRFNEALDRPAKALPELRRLFTEKSVLEQPPGKAASVRRRTPHV